MAIRSLGPVGVGDGGRELLLEVALRVVVLGEDDDPGVVPSRGGPAGLHAAEGRQARAHVARGSSRPDCGPGHRAGRGPPRRSRSSRRAAASRGRASRSWPTRTSSRVAASIWASSSAWSSSSESVARSSSLSTPSANRSGLADCVDPLGPSRRGCFQLPLDGAAMDPERAGERLDGREQTLLQPGDQQGRGWPACASSRRSSRSSRSSRYWSSSTESRSSGVVGRQAVDVDLPDDPLREPARDRAEVLLEPADHDVVEQLLVRTGTPRQNR